MRQLWRKLRREVRRSSSHVLLGITGALYLAIACASIGSTPDERFRRIWAFTRKHPSIFRLRSRLDRSFPQDWRNLIYLDIFRTLTWIRSGCVPAVIPVNHEPLVRLAHEGRPIVIVSLHSDLSTGLNALLERLGLDWAVITSSSHIPLHARWLGLKASLATIPNSENCFLIARRQMRDGKIIFCCPDYRIADSRPGRHAFALSDRIFDFARRTSASLVYAVPILTEDGSIRYTFSDPRLAAEFSATADAVADFLAFLDRFPGVNREWSQVPTRVR